MKNEPTHARTQAIIAGLSVHYQQRATLALALAHAVENKLRRDETIARVNSETPSI